MTQERGRRHMYGRILVALDGSPAGARAMDEAIRLATEQRALLRLLHVVEMPYDVDTIVAEGTRWPAELVVLGTHGHGHVHRLLGSTAEEVVRSTPVPVILVRDQ